MAFRRRTNSKLRLTQLLYEKRTFAVGTTLLQIPVSTDGISNNQFIPLACIFWQVATQPPKAVCIKSSETYQILALNYN